MSLRRIACLVLAVLFLCVMPSCSDEYELNELQKSYEGDWYGWWIMRNGTGDFDGIEQCFDCCGEFVYKDENKAEFSVWDEFSTRNECLGVFDVKVAEDGVAEVLAAEILGSDAKGVEPFDKDSQKYSDMIILKGTFTAPDGGGFDFYFALRPWGKLWDDVPEEDSDVIPGGYNTFYLPLVNIGKGMPDSIKIG